jgi:hypothetical protein
LCVATLEAGDEGGLVFIGESFHLLDVRIAAGNNARVANFSKVGVISG